jgi:hypothetical protein
VIVREQGKENIGFKMQIDREELAAAARAKFNTWDDERLTTVFNQAYKHTIGVQNNRAAARKYSLPVGMTLPEILLFRCNCREALYLELPSPRGGEVKDHLPPGYTLQRRYNFPFDLLLDAKTAVAQFQSDRTVEHFAGMLIAEARYALLAGWNDRLSHPPPVMTRERTIDALVSFFNLVYPAVMTRAERRSLH